MSVSITWDSTPVFHVITDQPIGAGTSYWGINVRVDPKKLVDMLGETSISDSYKTSKQWGFMHAASGAILTLYDWKETSLYDDLYPTPGEVWNGNSICLHIGHRRDDRDHAYFLADLLTKLAPIDA